LKIEVAPYLSKDNTAEKSVPKASGHIRGVGVAIDLGEADVDQGEDTDLISV